MHYHVMHAKAVNVDEKIMMTTTTTILFRTTSFSMTYVVDIFCLNDSRNSCCLICIGYSL